MIKRTFFFIIFLGFYLLFSSCTSFRRVVTDRYEDIYDYKIFPYTPVNTGNTAFRFKPGTNPVLSNYKVKALNRDPADTADLALDDFLKSTGTVSFLVIRNDSILFEKYYQGRTRPELSTVFSVSKSVTSLLIGMAIDDGYIRSVHDTVTRYIPELKQKAAGFRQLTIEDLLNMRSGFKSGGAFSSAWNTIRLYYGENQFKVIKKLKFAHEPGTVHEYQNASAALLGMILERATGKELGKYLEEKVWVPMGMEYDASWSLDDARHRSAKAFSGLNTTALDLAKIGRLYLKNGNWEGRQIINPAWIQKSVTPDTTNSGYQYQWYSFSFRAFNRAGKTDPPDSANLAQKTGSKNHPIRQNRKLAPQRETIVYPGDFYALGVMQQILYVCPQKNIVVVRLGEKPNVDYTNFIYQMIKSL